jgi:hypothetical protein
MYPFYLKSTFSDYSLHLCYLSSHSNPPSFSQICTVANEQGSVGGESGTTLAESATAQFTTRFSASETNVLGNKSYRIDAHSAYLHTSALRATRRPGSECVPLHHASRHAWIDIRRQLNRRPYTIVLENNRKKVAVMKGCLIYHRKDLTRRM